MPSQSKTTSATAIATRQSQLYTLRVWLEEVAANEVEIRGTLTHVLSSEVYHFRGLSRFLEIIESHVATTQDNTGRRIS